MSATVWTGFIDMGAALLEALDLVGISLWHEGDVTYVTDLPTAQAIAATIDPLAYERARKIAEVKAEAQRRIYAVVPAWKQSNLTARAAELAGKGRDNWTAEELAEWNAGQALWDGAKALRAASNLVEQDVAALTDWRQVRDFEVGASARWPD